MPKEVLNTYMAFINNIGVRNTVAGHLGEEYEKKASIPQADPMSVVVIALLMRAWIVEMKHYAVQPRLLADDLQIISTGERHLKHFEYAYNQTDPPPSGGDGSKDSTK